MSYPRLKRRKDRQAFADYARLNGDLDALADHYRYHPNPPMRGLIALNSTSRRCDFPGRLAEARTAQAANTAAQPAPHPAAALSARVGAQPPVLEISESQGRMLVLQEMANLLRQTSLRLAGSEDPALLGILPRVVAQLRLLLSDLLQERSAGSEAGNNHPADGLEAFIQILRLSAASEDELQTMRALLATTANGPVKQATSPTDARASREVE